MVELCSLDACNCLVRKVTFETAIRFECLCLFVTRKTLIDIQQLTKHNRQFHMANTDLHGMRKQFSFLRVLVSQQVTWVVKQFDARRYLKKFMHKKKKTFTACLTSFTS